MKHLMLLFVAAGIFGFLAGNGNAFQGEAIFTVRYPAQTAVEQVKPRSRIIDFKAFDVDSGLAYTIDAIFVTNDGGKTWIEMSLQMTANQEIVSVAFEDRRSGVALLYETFTSKLELARTSNGGATWSKQTVDLEEAKFLDLDLANASISQAYGMLEITVRMPTSANFTGRAKYRSSDGGRSWQLVRQTVELRKSDEAEAAKRDGSWTLETAGECAAWKTGCVQIDRLFISEKDVTPQRIKKLQESELAAARSAVSGSSIFAAPPGGSTRISLNRGFDKCTAAPASQMQLWWDNSYFHDANIYISGRNRGCSQPQLTSAWVNQVSTMGWGLIPTIVGYQSPCSSCTTCAAHSFEPAIAETQGRGEADIAVADATNLGLTAGSILYYDMERYDETAATPGCRTATTAFLKGWTERLREMNYRSGSYGSPRNAIDDWQFMPPASRMEAVWMARWDNVPSVWSYISFSNFPTNVWNDHQRIKQWQAPHNETWGGVTFNIDGNIADGPVAGVPIPRNKVADFDGDGKTDVSVFRPSTGEWFVSGTLGPTYNVYVFGVLGDTIAPGDFDGDGKTDLVVFRPSDSMWYLHMKGVFTARRWGEVGDIAAAADYDGDKRTDISVFRPSTGIWYFAYSDSRESYSQRHFGQAGDKPVAGDYDGDGKADVAVWRPSDGTWYVQGSAGNYYEVRWGVSTDLPAQADYDGDGRTDYAVFRPSTGTWYIIQSTEGFRQQTFGIAGDVPAAGDYDGDGRYDVAVFRPTDGTWYLSQSQIGYTVRIFGAPGDMPVPAAYLPQ